MARRCSAEVCSWLRAELVGRGHASHAEALVAGVEVVLFGIPEPRSAAHEDDILAETEAGEAMEMIIDSEGEILQGLGADLRARWLVARQELRRSSFFMTLGEVDLSGEESSGNIRKAKQTDKEERGELQQQEHQHARASQPQQGEEEEEEWEQLAKEGVDDSASCIGGFAGSCGLMGEVERQQRFGLQSCRGILSEPDLNPLCGDLHAEQVFNEMLARERAFVGEWAVFYHTYTSPALIYEVQAALATVLFKFGARCGALPRLLQAPFRDIPNATALMQAFPSWPDRDRNPAFKEVAICCATSLVSSDPQVTPTRVFRKGYNASVESSDMLESLLAKCGPSLRRSEVTSLVRAVMAAGVQYNLPQARGESSLNGHLLQIFIRRSCVDEWAYASQPLGVPDISRQPLSDTLACPGPICGQARLVVNPSVFMRASSVRLYAGSACKAFHENRPAFQKHLVSLLSPILGSSRLRRQAVEGICDGKVPSWWKDPLISDKQSCRRTLTEVGHEVDNDVLLREAVRASKETFSQEAAQRAMRHDTVRSSITYTLKVSARSDLRRLTVRWFAGASSDSIFDSICSNVRQSFGLFEVGTTKSPLTYLDDEGDECTLVASTLNDFLGLSEGGVLKLRVANCVVPTLTSVQDGRDVVSEEFSISTPRSLGMQNPAQSDIISDSEISIKGAAKELDSAEVEFAGESGDEQLEWTMF